jgi:hypothetical protein
MSLIDKVIKEANEQIANKIQDLDTPIVIVPRLEGKQEYTVREVLEQSRDKDAEMGKVIRMGIKGLLRRTGR